VGREVAQIPIYVIMHSLSHLAHFTRQLFRPLAEGCGRYGFSMFSRGNYDTHSNKTIKSDVSEHIVITKTNACMHSVPHLPSGGASVDEYECVQNEISYDTTDYNVFCSCATCLLLNSLVHANLFLFWHAPPEVSSAFYRVVGSEPHRSIRSGINVQNRSLYAS